MSLLNLFKYAGNRHVCSLGGKKYADCGFTLIEIILSILIIGISIPAIMTAFSGITASKNPEFVTQASFLAQKHMEKVADKKCSATNPCVCADFSIPPPGDYTLTCATVDVTASNPDADAGAPDFGTKLTLTIGRTDGEMAPVDFFALF